MIIKTFCVGMIETNCYVLIDEQSGEAAVIDPGDTPQVLLDCIKEYKLKYILLTHGHFDHVLGVSKIKELTGASVAIHKSEARCLEDERYSLAYQISRGLQKPCRCDIELEDEKHLVLGSLDVRVLHTPGHTVGGCCFVVDDTIFSGDTLFYGSVGRCDLPGGNYEQILGSLKKLDSLFKGRDMRVLPGHGEETTLDGERRYNPYMRHLV